MHTVSRAKGGPCIADASNAVQEATSAISSSAAFSAYATGGGYRGHPRGTDTTAMQGNIGHIMWTAFGVLLSRQPQWPSWVQQNGAPTTHSCPPKWVSLHIFGLAPGSTAVAHSRSFEAHLVPSLTHSSITHPLLPPPNPLTYPSPSTSNQSKGDHTVVRKCVRARAVRTLNSNTTASSW